MQSLSMQNLLIPINQDTILAIFPNKRLYQWWNKSMRLKMCFCDLSDEEEEDPNEARHEHAYVVRKLMLTPK